MKQKTRKVSEAGSPAFQPLLALAPAPKLTPTRPLLIGHFPGALSLFHFFSLRHFCSRVSPVPPFSSEPLCIWAARPAVLPSGPLCTVEDVDREVVGGRAPPAHWRRPLSGSAPAHGIGPARRGPARGPAPRRDRCVSRAGVECPASGLPSSERGCGVPRPPRESGGRGERAWIGVDGNCGVSRLVGLRSGLLLPRELAFTATAPSPVPRAPWARARGVGLALTRVSGQPRRREAGREGGAWEARRFARARGPGAARRGPLRQRGQPGARRWPPQPQFEEGV